MDDQLDPDEAASSFARALRARGGRGSGLQPTPLVDTNETVMEPQRFTFTLIASSKAQVPPSWWW